MLDPDQLVLLSLDFIFDLFILVLYFDLVGLSFALVDLLWRRLSRRVVAEVLITAVSLGGASTSAVLASGCCGGRHVSLL
jgi:hypothetical protein